MPTLTTWPVSPGDLIADTLDLKIDEIGAYLMLMASMWRSEDGTLPDDDCKLALICRVSRAVWKRRIRPAIGDRLQPVADGRLTQPRLFREHAEARERKAAAAAASRENGRRGGRPRHGPAPADREPAENLDGNPEKTQPEPRENPTRTPLEPRKTCLPSPSQDDDEMGRAGATAGRTGDRNASAALDPIATAPAVGPPAPEVHALADQVTDQLGVDPDKSSGWMMLPVQITQWTAAGYSGAEIETAARMVAGRCRETGRDPPQSPSYLKSVMDSNRRNTEVRDVIPIRGGDSHTGHAGQSGRYLSADRSRTEAMLAGAALAAREV